MKDIRESKEYKRQEALAEACKNPLFIHYLKGYLGSTVLGDLAVDFLQNGILKKQKKDLTTPSEEV